jgi:hypothetical protein
MYVCVVVLIATLALALAPAAASAASPVLEFVSGKGFPISFMSDGGEVTAALSGFETVVHCAKSHGEGEVIGPRSTISHYVLTGCETQGGTDGGRKCKSEDANAEEITTGMIEADLVYIDQAKHEVGVLLNPAGGIYINFECGGESVEGRGPFLAPVGPINQEATSFTATLSRSGAMQTLEEYENANGEKRQAIPMGKRGTHPLGTTGVELSFTVLPSESLEIKAITAEEIEAKQHQEEAATTAAVKKRQTEEAAAAAAAKKRQEEEAATTIAAKKRQAEEAATTAAAKKRREEEKVKSKSLTRRQQLTKAFKQCKKAGSKHKRMQCEKLVEKKYGSRR